MRVFLPRRPILDGRFLFQADRAGEADGGELTALLGIVADLGARGGFTPGGAAPRFIVRHIDAGEEKFRADLELAAIDGRFMECFRSCLTVAGRGDAYRRLELRAAAGDDLYELPVPDEVEGRPVYPGQRAPLQFVLTVDATITSRMRRAVLTMERSQTAADVATVEAGIKPWADALQHGAFVLPSIDPEMAANVFGGVQLFEADSIEIVVDRFDGSEEAFGILVNLLDRFARDHAAIRRVDLY